MTYVLPPLVLAAAIAVPNLTTAAPKVYPGFHAPAAEMVIEAKSEGKGKGKAKGKAKKQAKKKFKPGKGNGHAKSANKAKGAVKVDRSQSGAAAAIVGIPLAVIGTDGLADLMLDCPPGLAKKAVPCVPPGLVDKRVYAEEWSSRDDEDLRIALVETQRDIDAELDAEDVRLGVEPWDDDRTDITGRGYHLSQPEIVTIFDLDEAPEHHRYVVIDGRPVLLDAQNYRRIRSLRQLDEVEIYEVDDPELTSAIGHTGLMDIYDLPDPGPGRYYAMVDGDVMLLPEEGYELLQLLRVVALAPALTLAEGD